MNVPPAATEVHIEGNEQIINNDENMDVVSENLDKQVLKVKLLPSVENQEHGLLILFQRLGWETRVPLVLMNVLT